MDKLPAGCSTTSSLDTPSMGASRKASTRTGALPLLKKFSTTDGDGEFVHSSFLAQVFSVQIDQFGDDMERAGELYGSIEVVDIDGPLQLYDRTRESPEHIGTSRPISLTGPSRAISALTGFVVYLDLRLRKSVDEKDAAEDVVVCKWQFSWDVLRPEVAYITRGKFLSDFCNQPEELASQGACQLTHVEYDTPLTAVFREMNGCVVTMHYAILKFAVQAHVEVEVVHLDDDGEPTQYDVHGSVSARYGQFQPDSGPPSITDDQSKITLFEASDHLGSSSMKAECWKNLQLSRCVMAVPAYTTLIIEADLWHDSHVKIAKGHAVFKPYDHGCSVDYITGGDNRLGIRLIVCWRHETEIIEHNLFYFRY